MRQPTGLAISAMLVAACGGTRVRDSVLAPGDYGGEHVSLQVSASAARLEFDCAHGEIPSVIRLDSEGRFSVDGTFTQERGGPATTLLEDARPARYTGLSEDRVVTFTIRVLREEHTVGTFTAERGSPPRIVRCLLAGPEAGVMGGSPLSVVAQGESAPLVIAATASPFRRAL